MPPTGTTPKAAYDINEACRVLGISRPTIYKLIGAGRLRTVKFGTRRLVPVSAIEELLRGCDDL